MDFAAHTDNLDSRSDNAEIAETGLSVTVEVVMGAYKSVFDPLDLEIIDRVYEAAWAQLQAREPSRNAASDGGRQEALRRKIFGVARILGPGQIDFDMLI